MNCAIFSHAGVTWGKKAKTAVNISRCPKAKKAGDDCTIYGKQNFRQDYASYKFQAGPVKIKAPGCINAEGGIVWGPRHYMWWVETPQGRFKASFCGK